jgi:hypothetical protein
MNLIVPFGFGCATGLCIVMGEPVAAFFVFLGGCGMYFVMEEQL